MCRFCVVILLLAAAVTLPAREDSLKYRKRKFLLTASTSVLTVGSLAALDQAWYSQYHTGSFHLFNDNTEWLQMDKAGHVYSSYQTSRLMMQAFDWAHYSPNVKLYAGGTIGFIYLTVVEVMDGFSRGWGFSWGDQVSNLLGTGLAMGQEAAWHEQKFQLKFSFHESGLARYNPSLLGDSKQARLLKDYNAQKYWLSFSPLAFSGKSSKIPAFINVSLGYGAYGMLGGHRNSVVVRDEDGDLVHYERVRRYFLSLDLDLTKIRVKQQWLKTTLSILNIIKIPAPALEFSGQKFRFHYLLL